MSRQRVWQLKHKALGLCVQCDKPSAGGVHCLKCATKARISARKRAKCNEWQPGGKGRPPINR